MWSFQVFFKFFSKLRKGYRKVSVASAHARSCVLFTFFPMDVNMQKIRVERFIKPKKNCKDLCPVLRRCKLSRSLR